LCTQACAVMPASGYVEFFCALPLINDHVQFCELWVWKE
jgi:hypothetical protein